jgi:hypothetical protein
MTVQGNYCRRTRQRQQIQSVLGRNGFCVESVADYMLGKPSIGISCMQERTQGAATS